MKIFIIFLSILGQLGANNYKIKSYTIQEGLPTLEFYDAAQDTQGKMWFTCMKGIYSYDGYEWKLQSGKLFANTAVNAKIFIDPLNNIWIIPKYITKKIICLKNNEWITLPSILDNCHKDSALITSFDVSVTYGAKSIAIGTEYLGLFLFQNNVWQNIIDLPVNKINDLKIINDTTFAATDNGLLIIANNTIVRLLKSKPIFKIHNNKYSVDKKLWLLEKNRIAYLDGQSIKYLPYKTTLPFNKNKSKSYISVNKKNEIYISDYQSIFIVNIIDGKINKINVNDSDFPESITSFYIDREENIWVTSLREVKKIQKCLFTNYYKENGLLENEVTAIESFNDGTLVFGHNKGLSINYKGKIKPIPFFKGKKKN
ncbi:MAG: hypothetical protein PVH88_08145 [Ignavibacteria bacterium]